MAELSSSRLMQVLEAGQQKLEGRSELPHCWWESGHESEARGRMFRALVGEMLVARKVMRRIIDGFAIRISKSLAFAMLA